MNITSKKGMEHTPVHIFVNSSWRNTTQNFTPNSISVNSPWI